MKAVKSSRAEYFNNISNLKPLKYFKKVEKKYFGKKNFKKLNKKMIYLFAYYLEELESGNFKVDEDGKKYLDIQSGELAKTLNLSKNTVKKYRQTLNSLELINTISEPIGREIGQKSRVYIIDNSLIKNDELANKNPYFEDKNGNILELSFLNYLEKIIEKKEREEYKKLKTGREKADYVFKTLIDSKNNKNCFSLLCSQNCKNCFYSHSLSECENLYYSYNSHNCKNGQRLSNCKNLRVKEGEFLEYFENNRKIAEEIFLKI